MDKLSYVCKVNKIEFILFLFLYFRNLKWKKIRSEQTQARFDDAVILETALIFYFFQVWTKYLEIRFMRNLV